jgi:tetratricopeptide (TPR) repeat protein
MFAPKISRPSIFRRYATEIVLSFLLLMTVSVFWQVSYFDFVHYDDTLYVSENPHIRHGLTPEGFRWAWAADLVFDSPHADYWQPVTFLSRMADISLWGLNPGGHHVTNLLLHLANVFLLFLFLIRTTKTLWPAVWITAVFALHPVQVDPVAWVTARKDVLSTFFALLALLTYTRYAVRRTLSLNLLVAFFFALSLLAKPLWLPLPGLLLIMDFWPLGRFQKESWTRLAAEKWILAAVSLAVAFLVIGGQSGIVTSALQDARLREIPVSYVRYLWKTIFPAGLAVRYPEPDLSAGWKVAFSVLLLAGVTVFAFRARGKHRYFLTGWLWFLAALAPSVGLVHENRFMYVPLVGLAFIAGHGIPKLFARWKIPDMALTVASTGLVALYAVASSFQTSRWENSFVLFQHALRVTSDNAAAHNGLAGAYLSAGNAREAIRHYAQALRIDPSSAHAHHNLGLAFAMRGNTAVAMRHYQIALALDPQYARAHNSLGAAWAKLGHWDEATRHFEAALRMHPRSPDPHMHWANSLFEHGKFEEAVSRYRDALALGGSNPELHHNLGVALTRLGRYAEARQQYDEALRLKPAFPEALRNMGLALSRMGKFAEAHVYLARSLALRPSDPETLNELGIVCYMERKFDEAIRHFEAALKIKPAYLAAQNNLAQARTEMSRLEVSAGKPA